MSILIDRQTRIVISGIESGMAQRQYGEMVAAGTHVVGAITTLGMTGRDGIRLIEDFQAAVAAGAEVGLFFDAPLNVRPRVLAAIGAGLRKVVCLTEFVPAHDAVLLRQAALDAGVLLIGPNSSGVLSAGACKAGYFADTLCIPGSVGILTKGGSIAYGVLTEMAQIGLGVSTIVSVGPDLVKGAGFSDLLASFRNDPATEMILLLGEIGGRDEEDAAAAIAAGFPKPVVAYVSGRFLKEGSSIGHAVAIMRNGIGGYLDKVGALRAAGATVVENFRDIVPALQRLARGSSPSGARPPADRADAL